MPFPSRPRTSDDSVPLFAAAFEDDIFQSALNMISAAFPGTAVLIVGQDSRRLAGNFLLHEGGSAELTRAFQAELGRSEGWAQHQWTMDVGQVYQDRELGGSDASAGHMARAFAAASPALECYAGIVFCRSGSRQFAIEVRYPRHREAELRQPLRDYLHRIAAQLELAVRVARLRDQVSEAEQLASNLLDLMPFPVVLLNGAQRVLRMNSRAQSMIRVGMVLGVGPDGILHMTDPGAGLEFVDQFAALRDSLSQRVAIMTVPHHTGELREILTLVRLKGAPLVGQGPLAGETGPLFAVVCENLSMPMELSQDILWRVFGLSAKEADLAVSLLAGESIGDLAVRRKVSKETLRNQLAAVMRKTDTARQQELIALLTRLATVHATV